MEITTQEVRDFLAKIQGQRITLRELRGEFNIQPGSKSFDAVRNIMFQLAEQREVRPIGHRGEYKVVTQVQPVKVSGKIRREPIELFFPRDFDTMMEMDFAGDIVIREGDLILLSGQSNYGKTTLCMNFCGENIEKQPVLMGNEYTNIDGEPAPRFLTRLDDMDWVNWTNGDGSDNFVLLPVREDYAEHIVKDKINIIDWINLPTELYMISSVMESIKRELGKGVGIIAIQKAEGTTAGRGGQFTKDFADCELLLDRFGQSEVLLTIGKVKEYKRPVIGRTFAYGIWRGVKILHFREVIKCPKCHGKKWVGTKPCENCETQGYVDKATKTTSKENIPF